MPELYSRWYLWGDPDLLGRWMRGNLPERPVVVEVASGPNIVVPWLLARIFGDFVYISVDLELRHLELQRRGARPAKVLSVLGRGSRLPLKDGVADLFVFHHAVDDILETEGWEGVRQALSEAVRVTRPGGTVAFSHCPFPSDRFSLMISLNDAERLLRQFCQFEPEREKGVQDWLFARNVRPLKARDDRQIR